MEVNVVKIFKQSLQLVKGYKFFWLLGLFLIWLTLLRSAFLISDIGARMGLDNFADSESMNVPAPSTSSNAWIGIIFLVFAVLALIYYFRSKGALVVAVDELRTKKEIDKKLVYGLSEPHTVKLMKVGAGLSAVMLLIAAMLISPVVYLSSNGYTDRATYLGLIAALIYLPIFCLLYYASIFTPMFIVLQGMTINGGLKASLDLIRRFWPTLLAFSVGLLLIEVILLVLTLILMGVSALPFVLLLNVFYDTEGRMLATTLQVMAIIVGFMVFFASAALLTAFQRVAWTVAFFEIIKPVKVEETAEIETLPEVIS